MRDRITAIIAVLLLAALAGSTYWYSVSTRLGAIPNAVSREGPDVIGEKVTLTQFDAAGRAVNKLLGERITHYPSDDRADVVQPRMVTLREDQPQIDARADHALVEQSGARVTLTGNVILNRAAGKDGEPPMRLTTEKLVALPDVEQFETDAPVTIERGGSRINTVGMDYDNIKRSVKFRSQVRGSVEPAATNREGR